MNAIKLAEFMHNKYEMHSKKMGWNTQKSCKVKFNDLPSENKAVMIAVAHEVLKELDKYQERQEPAMKGEAECPTCKGYGKVSEKFVAIRNKIVSDLFEYELKKTGFLLEFGLSYLR